MSQYRSIVLAAFALIAGIIPGCGAAIRRYQGRGINLQNISQSWADNSLAPETDVHVLAKRWRAIELFIVVMSTRLGLDLGVKAAGVMVWGVFAPTSGVHHGALAGTYIGGSGDIALGVGVGAKALIGGSHRSFALQPLSVREGQVGVNLALGVAGLRLDAAH